MKVIKLVILVCCLLGFENFYAQNQPNRLVTAKKPITPNTPVIVILENDFEKDNLESGLVYNWTIDNIKDAKELAAFINTFEKQPVINSVVVKSVNGINTIAFSVKESITLKTCFGLFANSGISFFRHSNLPTVRSIVQ